VNATTTIVGSIDGANTTANLNNTTALNNGTKPVVRVDRNGTMASPEITSNERPSQSPSSALVAFSVFFFSALLMF
jgi:hypothetical protein